ncbi:SDR family NAD(P)-dependent oxidoreductase [Nodularia sphaerocarpa]|uniref:SDR family NAD(P)-dependent oxidoreductase n=1 Tax=Nodularia sphaerocarpa TaxID=137816 RepID=UPI001EFBAF3A|nr:SDR family NAD(P)-dependent oxidoreductase [Nodularia sphaerocarpa]MDB9371863.1 SDR family NAD(P)-dependent oxidoreductase [Nodularia sphaerocarpa CS-585]MDB9379892.1 SDR family NAD(P)-dependent oxidoreductase [Nodularia sphaerocarpa CS-585A2]ULP74471.1 putative oxidoreductase [Nodularia sphaerocarpa UHCC 0038]
MTSLKGKTVLLTGASRGLGVYIARNLAKEQATIVGVSRSKLSLDKVSDQIKAVGGKWISIPFDMTNVGELSNLATQIHEIAGPVDILINNAGVEMYRNFVDYSLAEIQSILTTNLVAAVEITRLLLPSMLERRSGHIVNIASVAGKKGIAYNSIYSASKAGLILWSDAIRQELAGTDVNISAICPGYISKVGMTVKTRVPVPQLAGISTPSDAANAVIKSIKYNRAEVIVNESPLTEALTKLMFAIGQLYPEIVDTIYRLIGVVKLNQIRAETWNSMEILPNQLKKQYTSAVSIDN